MYRFYFVIFVTLASIAAAFGSNCTSYYVLMQKYYDPDINTTILDMHTENHYANKLRVYNQKINWKTFQIHTDVPNLERFDHNCVVDLACRDVRAECLQIIKPKSFTGTDHRIIDKTNTTMSNIATDHGIEDETLKKTNLSEPNHKIEHSALDENLELTKTNKTTTTIATDHGIEDEILKKVNLSEPDHNIEDSTLDDNLELTTVTNTNNTNNSNISADHGKKDETFLRSTLNTTNEIANAKETTDLNNNVIDLESKTHNAEVDPVENKNKSTEETTDINKEVILLKNETALHNSNNTKLNKFGKYSSQTNEQTSAVQAGKVAAGIMGAGTLVAVVLVAKKMIVGCLQSGVYNIPA